MHPIIQIIAFLFGAYFGHIGIITNCYNPPLSYLMNEILVVKEIKFTSNSTIHRKFLSVYYI